MKRNLQKLFSPSSVALVGASNEPGKWGCVILSNLIRGGFAGRIYPVNPREEEILGRKAYRSVAEIPETPDLAVIVVPPLSVLPVLEECLRKGTRAGIVITAGFAEIGEKGRELQREMAGAARAAGMSLVGPNCNGIMNPWDKVHIQFPAFLPPPGPIAVVAQSGNVMDSISRQIMIRGLGCSKCISSGNEADLRVEDYLEYLAGDPHTRVILAYVEGFRGGHRILEIAAEVSRKKPVVMVKAGRTAAGARAAMSHTASIVGSDALFDALCRQTGVIRARTLEELLQVGAAFLRQPLPRGRRVGIVTAGGGWGVIAADAAAEQGLEVAALPEETLREMDGFLPAWWSRGNPVDLVAGSRGPAIFRCVELLLGSPVVDGVLVLGIMTALPGSFSVFSGDPARQGGEENLIQGVVGVLEEFNGLAAKYGKPVLVASEQIFADGPLETRITHALGQKESICYPLPHQPAAVFAGLVHYAANRKNGYAHR